MGWFLFVACILAVGVEKGYSEDLYKASLTGASLSSYDRNVEGKISIKDNGKVELSIKGLRSYPDNKLVSQNCTLVIETEVNDSPKTYSETFLITDGDAEWEFTLKDLNKDDKLEIASVTINKSSSTSATPTVTASPTPTSSPTATPSASPTSTSSPTSIVAQIFNASTTSGDTIMVPGGLISESTTATPTPATTSSPTATASPTPATSPTTTPAIVVEAKVSITPKTINLNKKGKFKAFIISLSDGYSVDSISGNTIECNGAPALDDGKIDDQNRFVATFNVQELDSGSINNKDGKAELTVSGELTDGKKFEGSDTVRIKGKGKGNGNGNGNGNSNKQD